MAFVLFPSFRRRVFLTKADVCNVTVMRETQLTYLVVAGRLCQPFPTLQGNVSCCLPCPATDWIYSDGAKMTVFMTYHLRSTGFVPRTEAANWLNLAALIASIFLLLSFVVLPVKWTHRHYLSICLSVGVVFIEVCGPASQGWLSLTENQLAFVIPQAARPDQCHNEITPNDMHTSLTCAFSGAFLLFGGWAAMMWVLYRALFLHLQICWQIVPGVKFFWSALVIGWGIPAAGLTLALSLTGVSFRFGNVCHINHSDSLGDFWGPLLFVAACSLVIQAITFGYCIKVYLKSVMDPKTTTDNSSALPSYQGSTQSISPRQKYRRIQKVLYMQWRGVAVVMLIIFNVVFFSVVFVSMDNNLQATNAHVAQIEPWLACLSLTQGNKVQCLPLAKDLVTNEATIIAVLVFISVSFVAF